jgi:predicted membrane protein
MKKFWLLFVLLFGVDARSQYRLSTGDVGNESSQKSKYCLLVALTGNSASNISGEYRGASIRFLTLIDSGVYTSIRQDSFSTDGWKAVLRVSGEVVMGGVMGCIVAIPGGLIGYEVTGGGSWNIEGPLTGAYVGYVLGSSLGVYMIGKQANQNASFLETLAGGIIGAGAALGFVAMMPINHRGVAAIGLPILPVALSIIFVELIE